MARRIRESGNIAPYQGFGPVTEIRIREILQFSEATQRTLPGLESHYAELKEDVPKTKESKAKIIKAMASFSNNSGGYLFFGIQNDGTIIGVDSSCDFDKMWDDISELATSVFSPFFSWDRNVIDVIGCTVPAIYVHPSPRPPIVSVRDYTREIDEGQIYFRYERATRLIRAGDLFQMLSARDRACVSGDAC